MQNPILQWFAQKFLDRTLKPRELLTARKLVYTGLIVLLFTGSFFWRRNVEAQANDLAVREENRGDLELSSSVLRLTLTGSQGLAASALWMSAIEKQKKNQWNELEFQVRWLTRLQPHFITPWLFQSWNLSYNVSVESDRVFDKYFYVSRGISLLADGERQNHDYPDLRYFIGFYLQNKINVSDETNVMRSLFQLSCIPPSQRDPARFRTGAANTFNAAEFEKFCKEHPQLVRRLRHGLRRDSKLERTRQFTCEDPRQVEQFLRDNFRVPSLYEEGVLTPADSPWQKDKVDRKKDVEERFPPMPPSPTGTQRRPFEPAFDFRELNDRSDLGDEVGALVVARSWYSYAQEPLPNPAADLPGYSQEIVDRAHQRRPRNMATLIFRQYPALVQTHLAEQLQKEGWFDDVPWNIPGWLPAPIQVSVARAHTSEQAYSDAVAMWKKHGEATHVLFKDASDEINMRELAERYWKMKGLPRGSDPPMALDVDRRLPQQEQERQARREYNRFVQNLPDEERELFKAAKYMYEYEYYRRMSNFAPHYIRALVEREKSTITARRHLYHAETLRLEGDPKAALREYTSPGAIPAWRDAVLSVNDLRVHKDYREEQGIQEQTFEIQLRYLELINDEYGKEIKREIAKRIALMTMAGQISRQVGGALLCPECLGLAFEHYQKGPISLAWVRGPFDVEVLDDKQVPLEASALSGMLATPLPMAPLLATSSLGAWQTRPLLDPGVVQMVLGRRNLLPTKKDAKRPPDMGGGPGQ